MYERESCEQYSFNLRLDRELDDGYCVHCGKYLTTYCPHIDEFMEDEFNGA